MTLLPSERVVITGGSGFVGTNLVSFYAERGWEIRNFDILPPRNRNHDRYWRRVDLLDRDTLIRELRDFRPSVVLHFGARTDLDESVNLAGYAANIEGVCNVVDAIRATPSVARAIFASSQLVCRIGYVPRDENDYHPTTLYGSSKVLTERIVRAADDIGAVWTIVRPTSLWGPWFDVPYKNFFLAIARNLYVHPGATKTLKQWGFIGNAVFQVWTLVRSSGDAVHKRTFYLADYEPLDLRTFANTIQVALHARPIRTVPPRLLALVARLGDVAQTFGWTNPPLTSFRYNNIVMPELQDLEALKEVVGPLPYTSEQGIDITVRWLRQQEDTDDREDLPLKSSDSPFDERSGIVKVKEFVNNSRAEIL